MGKQKMTPIGIACILLVLLVAASYVGYGTARNAVPLFLGALIYGVGEYFISTAALSRMLGNWFQSHLGVVTGIVMAASGVGGSALSLVLSGIMESAGWRAALLFAAMQFFPRGAALPGGDRVVGFFIILFVQSAAVTPPSACSRSHRRAAAAGSASSPASLCRV